MFFVFNYVRCSSAGTVGPSGCGYDMWLIRLLVFFSIRPQVRVSARIQRKPTRYEVSVVTRDEVGAYKPYLWEQSVFEKGPMFR